MQGALGVACSNPASGLGVASNVAIGGGKQLFDRTELRQEVAKARLVRRPYFTFRS